ECDCFCDGVLDGFGAAACECRSVLHSFLDSVSFHSGKWQQDGVPSGSVDEVADRRTIQSDDEIAFPVAGYAAVGDLGGTPVEGDLGGDEAAVVAPGTTGPRPRDPHRPPRP